jgi:arginase family enzyme
MSAVTELAFTDKVKEFYDEQVLIPVRIPLPLLSDPEHGYFSEIVLPPDRASEADVVLLGFPIDIGASYRMIPGVRPSGGSPSEGSMGVRRGLGFCRTYAFPLDVDLKTAIKVADLGNIFISNTDRYEEAFGKFSAVYQEIMKLGATPLVMGGDNSTTYISFKNFAEFHDGKVGLIWLDAHTDTADDYRGDRYWCGSPMARILELPSSLLDPGNVVMLGIRGFDHSAGMIRVALEAGVHMIPAEFVHEQGILPVAQEILDIVQNGTKAFYVMWDPDVMEAIFIPGHAVPTTGGLYPHQLKQLFRMVGLCGAGGFEVVEVAPGLDVRDMTIRLASESVLEFISGLARAKQDGVQTPAQAAEIVRKSMEPRRKQG